MGQENLPRFSRAARHYPAPHDTYSPLAQLLILVLRRLQRRDDPHCEIVAVSIANYPSVDKPWL